MKSVVLGANLVGLATGAIVCVEVTPAIEARSEWVEGLHTVTTHRTADAAQAVHVEGSDAASRIAQPVHGQSDVTRDQEGQRVDLSAGDREGRAIDLGRDLAEGPQRLRTRSR